MRPSRVGLVRPAHLHERRRNVIGRQSQEQGSRSGKGHAKEAAGKATNDRSLEAKGKKDKAAGNVKQAGEKVKDAFKK